MTIPQTAVNIFSTLGFPGELAFDGPRRAQSAVLNSSGQAQTIGFAFTLTSGGNPDPSGNSSVSAVAQVGGTGVFAGILVNPKAYSSNGTTAAGPLAPTLNLPDYTQGELLFMGEVFISLGNAANVGDQVFYNTTTGALVSAAPFVGTGTAANTTASVVAVTTGTIATGSAITFSGGPEVFVTAWGTGTGGVGTYTIDPPYTQAAVTAISAPAALPAGCKAVPHGVISRYDVAAAGIAVLKITE